MEILQGHKDYGRLFPVLWPMYQSFSKQLDELNKAIERDVGDIEIFCEDYRRDRITQAKIKRKESKHLKRGHILDEMQSDSILFDLEGFFESLLDPFILMSSMFRDAQEMDVDIMYSILDDSLCFLWQRLALLAEVVKRVVGTISLRTSEANQTVQEAFLDGKSYRKPPQEEKQSASAAPDPKQAEKKARQGLEETKGQTIVSFVKMLVGTNADDKMIGEVCRNLAMEGPTSCAA